MRKLIKQNGGNTSKVTSGNKLTKDEENKQENSPVKIRSLSENRMEQESDLQVFLEQEYRQSENMQGEIESLCQEDDDGNIEYKLKLVNPPEERIQQLTTQMKFRLAEGNGEAIYEIGVQDNGVPLGLELSDMIKSLKTLCSIASYLKADVIILQMKQGIQGKIAEILVRKNQKDGIKLDIRVLVLGDVGSGKSTLIGVLISGQKDNGKGLARMKVFHHKHEVLSGRTSSLSHHILGFDSQGNITNHSQFGNLSWEQIVDLSTKLLTFIDLGGHSKYVKTIIYGLCSHYPDYAILVISCTQGLTVPTENHFKLALGFQVPIILVLTHVDCVSQDQLDNVITQIKALVKKEESGKIPLIVRDDNDVVLISRTLKENIVPLFLISNVTGSSLELFKTFLNLLPISNEWSTNADMHTEFYIHERFDVKGNIILGGTVIKGQIKIHQILHLGPDEKGKFRNVEVVGIHCKRVAVRSASCGQACTVAIRPGKFALEWLNTNSQAIRRGMVLVDGRLHPKAYFEFQVQIRLLSQSEYTPVQLTKSYEPVINSQTTRQACIIIQKEQETQEDLEEDQNLPNLQLVRLKSKSTDINNTKPEESDESIKIQKTKKIINRQQRSFSIKEDLQNKYTNRISRSQKYTNSTRDNLNNNSIKLLWNKPNLLRLRFKYYPEYILKEQKIIINDQNLKAIGVIKDIYY